MIKSIDLIKFAARHGMILNTQIAKEALSQIDREALEEEERKRWHVVMWDGEGDPPVGERHHFIHENDAIGRHTKEAFEQGHVVYFLFRDGKLHHYQPFRAYERGHHKLRKDPNHEHHWKKAADDHINIEVEREVDMKILDMALEKALELHEQRGIPVGMTAYTGHVQ
jgi:hypothetical protein